MKKLTLGIAIIALAGLTVVATSRTGQTQAGGAQLVVGIYAPTVNFGSSEARLNYVQNLAKAIEGQVNRNVRGQSFTSMAQLQAAKPAFAIVEGQCVAAKSGMKILANGVVNGSTTRGWALYSNSGTDLQALKGKKLAYVKTGCSDNEFIENAMLESEVKMSWFGGTVPKQDLNGAVATVATLKGAEAVFAPRGSQKGLAKVFDTTSVPTPAFVQLDSGLPGAVVENARKAVTGFAGTGAISGWGEADSGKYTALRGKFKKRTKSAVFAPPTPVRFDAKDVLIEPKTLDDAEFTQIEQHFEKPPERQ